MRNVFNVLTATPHSRKNASPVMENYSAGMTFSGKYWYFLLMSHTQYYTHTHTHTHTYTGSCIHTQTTVFLPL